MSNSDPSRQPRELLVLCQLFYPELVSTGQTLTELCEQLAERGLSIEVVCGRPTVLRGAPEARRRIQYRTIRIRRVWGTRFNKLHVVGRLCNQITFAMSTFLYLLFNGRRRPILVLTNPPFLAVSCAILRWLRLGGPYIYLVFDIYPDTAVNLGLIKSNSLISRLWNGVNRLIFHHAAYIVVIGRCMEEIIRRKTAPLRHSEEKIRRIHIWCDEKALLQAQGTTQTLRREWNLQGKFVVGYFGNMGRFHDIKTILAAAGILRDHGDIVFLFVGEGHKKQWAASYVEHEGLANCRFHTHVPREALGPLLATADVGLVSLVKGQEGLSVPSKAIALMGAGVPIVAIMDVASEIARIICEEECGVRVEPGDACGLRDVILRMRSDDSWRQKMGENGRKAVTGKYSLPLAAQSYERLIDGLET